RGKLEAAITARPDSEAGAAALESARQTAEGADVAEGAEGEPPGPLEDAYHLAFEALYAATWAECAPTDATALALVVASSDTLYACAGGALGLDQFTVFAWPTVYKSVSEVARAAGRLGDPLWCEFLYGINPDQILKGEVYETLPAHLRPEALDMVLRTPKLRAALAKNTAVLDVAIADVSPSDPVFQLLADAVVSRDAGKLSPAGLRAWTARTSSDTLAGLSATAQGRLLAALSTDVVLQAPPIQAWLDAKVKVETRMPEFSRLYDLRFDLSLDKMGETDIGALQRVWAVFAALPPGHVAENDFMRTVRKMGSSSYAGGGYSSKEGGTSYLEYPAEKVDSQQLGVIPNLGAAPSMRPVNALDHMVRHEIGHSVDEGLGVMAARRGQAAFGGWELFSGDTEAATALTSETGATTTVSAAALGTALASGKTADVKALGSDGVVTAAAKAVELGAGAWVGSTPTTEVGDHVYSRLPDGSWQRYDADARKRKVSDYQFKTPGEWFAEAYAAYYDGDAPGGKLTNLDGPMATWLTNNVHDATVGD
ncbi:MAG: hypothetical protein ACI8PZ_006794, partial [Myxococcota bacterium]